MIHRVKFLTGVVMILIAFHFNQPAFAQSVRIMNVGDSDVSGYSGYASYRYDLWFMLSEAGYDVDFVGRTMAPISLVNEDLYPAYEDFDSQHEGRFGRVLSEVSSQAQAMVESNAPHIVLILISEDACQSGSGAIGLANIHLSNTIDNMRAVDPDLHFLLGQVYPYENHACDPDLPQVIPDYNQAIAQIASNKNAPGSRVMVVDHYNGFNSGAMFDATAGHANRQGEMFIAGNWFDALETVIPLVEVEDDSFVINAGLNDAWFDPTTPGQGFFITVFPNIEMMFLAWFTYDTERPAGNVEANLGEPGHRWLTAFGPYSDNIAELEVELTRGGVFDSANPAPDQEADGTIRVDFAGCNQGTVTYDIHSAAVSGVIPIERIAVDNVPACEVLAQ